MEIYHVFTKSIAKFTVFLDHKDYARMIELLKYYKNKPILKFSDYKKLKETKVYYNSVKSETPFVEIIAYCLMPTHIHLVLQEISPSGISEYMRIVLDSYTRYFNKRIGRKGPLWEGRVKRVLVESDEQLLHLTRYVHLNPVSAGIVEKPEDWVYSSYREYIGMEKEKVCNKEKFFDFSKKEYKKFVEDRIDYQRSLEIIKHIILE
uniref:Transposase IS200-like domain-containing protein n=1 Tax=Thermodesulfobacterium geofontis TaxID=1295609 RepID=A0A7C4NYZ4_9BACT